MSFIYLFKHFQELTNLKLKLKIKIIKILFAFSCKIYCRWPYNLNIMWDNLHLFQLKIERQCFVLYFSTVSFTMNHCSYESVSNVDGRVWNTATSTVQI